MPHLTGGDARSLAEVLVTVVGYATAPLIAARHLKDVPTLQLITPCLTLAAVVYAPAAFLTRPAALPRARPWPPWPASASSAPRSRSWRSWS